MNHNVKVALWWSLWENVSASLRSGDVFSAYLYLLTGFNSTVGWVQGINGILQLLAALPAGWAADRHRRDTMLRLGAVVGLAAGLFLGWALAVAPTVWALALSMALLGCYRGVYSSALEALFADSVPSGRSSLYTWRYVVTVLASSCGPWLSLVLFWRLGNQWQAEDCRLVLLAGLGLMALPLLLMCFFDDDKALSHHQATGSSTPSSRQPAGSSSGTAAPGRRNGGDDVVVSLLDGERCDSGSSLQKQRCCACCSCGEASPGLIVTLLISSSDLIGALASGMTLKFSALFFMQVVGLSPMAVSLLGAVSPLGISAAALLAQRASKLVGRVQISLCTRLVDIGLLVCMAYLPSGPGPGRHALVAAHLLRMSFANCTRPLMRSVLMDQVTRQHRGKVNAVESVRMFSWSGSAAAGGMLIDLLGFQGTFLVTAVMKTASFLPLVLLLGYVPDGVCLRRRHARGGEGPLAAGYSLVPDCAADTAAGMPAAAAAAPAAAAAAAPARRGSSGEQLPANLQPAAQAAAEAQLDAEAGVLSQPLLQPRSQHMPR